MNPQERRNFAWYLGGILLTTPVLAHLFYNMWLGGGYVLARHLTIVPFVPDGVTGVEALISLGFGVYLGLLVLYSNDYRKRYQGLLLLSGLVVLVGGLTVGGLGLGITPLNAAALVAGVVVGIAVEAVRSTAFGLEGELRLVSFEKSSLGNAVRDDDEAAQFRVASLALVAVTVLAVVAGNALYVAVSPPGLETYSFAGAYAVGSLVFFYFLHGFITLDPTGEDPDADPDTTSFEVMGPKQSGKTYFALALFLEVLNDEEKYDLEGRSKGIRWLVNEYNNAGDDLRWDIANTLPDEAFLLRFEFIARSRLNPSRIEVNMLDHAGEILSDVSENLSGERTVTDGGEPDEDDDSEEAAVTLPGNAASDGEIAAKVLDRNAEEESDAESDEERSAEDKTPVGSDAETVETDDRGPSDGDHETEAERIDANASPLGTDASTADTTTESTAGTDASATAETDTGSSVDPDVSSVETDTESSTVDPDDEPEPSAEEPSGGAAETAENTEEDDSEAEETTDEDDDPAADVNREPVSKQDEVIKRVENNVKNADKLVFLLDSERFHNHTPDDTSSPDMYVEEFSDIVENVDVEDVVLVASKADFFIEEWQEEKGHRAQPNSTAKRFESFREHVTERMMGDLQIKGLARMVNASTIHPVYFVTEERDGELLPKPDKQGNIQPAGVEKVLESIIST